MEEINLASTEDITNFSDEEQVSLKQLNYEFRQESKLKGIVREFTIFNFTQCYQKVSKKHGGKQKFRVDLTYLDADPKRIFILSDSWFITAVVSAILGFLLVYAGWFSGLQLSFASLPILSSMTIAFSCIAFLIAILRTSDRVLMYSRHGRVPILEFINKNPDARSFTKFLGRLHKHIQYAQKASKLTTTQQLTMELKELRRLKDEMVISVDNYEQAKRMIFKNQAFKSENAG